jgi:hypothetical protein
LPLWDDAVDLLEGPHCLLSAIRLPEFQIHWVHPEVTQEVVAYKQQVISFFENVFMVAFGNNDDILRVVVENRARCSTTIVIGHNLHVHMITLSNPIC